MPTLVITVAGKPMILAAAPGVRGAEHPRWHCCCQQLALMLADKQGSDVLVHEHGRLLPVSRAGQLSRPDQTGSPT
jgi:hypothetical protein